MNFQHLPFDIHDSLSYYLEISDLISLSQTSSTLRDYYFGPAWHSCLAIAPGRYKLSLRSRPFSAKALLHHGDTPIIRKIKRHIETLEIPVSISTPNRSENLERSFLEIINSLDYPSLKKVIVDFHRIISTTEVVTINTFKPGVSI